MNWNRLYRLLELDQGLLQDASLVRLLEQRLKQLEAAADRIEEQALRCDRLLEQADMLRRTSPPNGKTMCQPDQSP